MTQVFHKAKWFVPIIVIVAMLAAVGLVWSQSGGSSPVSFLGTSNDNSVTKTNPAYDDQVVTPSEVTPVVLWSVTMDPPTSTVAIGGGTVATVVLTNNIPAPLNMGTSVGKVVGLEGATPGIFPAIIGNGCGDLTGDLYVTADIYNELDPSGCLTVYNSAAYGLGTPGAPSTSHQVVKIYKGITVHPGLTVTFQVPVLPGAAAVPGAEFMLKAQFCNVTGLMDGTTLTSPTSIMLNPFVS